MDGVLVIDKPQGVTSHDVVAVARRTLREKRIGHTGTLDPLATGVLPLACGRATRLVRFLAASDKEYDAVIRFGLTTDTYDITGTVLTESGVMPSRDRIETALASLRGEYAQVPPAYSAKRVGRQRAYALARRNEVVALEPVRVRVSRAGIVDVRESAAVITLACSAGFYVRTFAHALGELTGAGACLEALRRTRSGDFGLDTAVGMDALAADSADAAARLVRMDELLPQIPAARLTAEGRKRVDHGREVEPAHLLPEAAEGPSGASQRLEDAAAAGAAGNGWVRLLDASGCLVAMATRRASGALHPAIVLV